MFFHNYPLDSFGSSSLRPKPYSDRNTSTFPKSPPGLSDGAGLKSSSASSTRLTAAVRFLGTTKSGKQDLIDLETSSNLRSPCARAKITARYSADNPPQFNKIQPLTSSGNINITFPIVAIKTFNCPSIPLMQRFPFLGLDNEALGDVLTKLCALFDLGPPFV